VAVLADDDVVVHADTERTYVSFWSNLLRRCAINLLHDDIDEIAAAGGGWTLLQPRGMHHR
jgi:hypothetical protein